MKLPVPIRDLRNKLLGNPSFRAAAGRIWPFNLIARRRARELFDISAGFVYSQVLMTCIELGWFERMRAGPVRLEDLSEHSSLPLPAVLRLAEAAHSLGLTEARGDASIALGPLGASMIGDEGISAMATHHAMLYADMAAPLSLLRGQREQTALSDFWGYAVADDPGALSADRVQAYSALMAASQPMIAEQVLTAFDFSQFNHLLDVGGGTGAFLRAVHARYPALKQSLFDLPGVVAHVDADAADAPAVFGGSFRAALPDAGADLISLVRIVHDHDDDVVLELLRNVRQVIPAHGTLLIAEPMAGTPGAEAVGGAYFGFYLLAMGSGRARTKAEIDGLLKAAGFGVSRVHKTPIPLICSVISANPV